MNELAYYMLQQRDSTAKNDVSGIHSGIPILTAVFHLSGQQVAGNYMWLFRFKSYLK